MSLTAQQLANHVGRALEMARDYALERYAFGRPIGSYQAIKHKLADVFIRNEVARVSAYYGAWALSSDAPELPVAAAAGIAASRLARLPLSGGGNMSGLTSSRSLSTTMLRTTFCSSRTLPGQG